MEYVFRLIASVIGVIRGFYRQVVNRYFGRIERFEGTATEICQQIMWRLWHNNFYRTSLGHFDFFWIRDFGTACSALVELGNTAQVHHTLRWALKNYRRVGTVTLCIDHWGNTFNAPNVKSVDALPWLMHSLAVSQYPLTRSDRVFLDRQLRTYIKKFLDPKTGLIRREIIYAEMRDAVAYDRSAYAVALVGRMAACVATLKLNNFPFSVKIYRKELLANYWNGRYFSADMMTNAFSAECALIPFWLNIVYDEKKFAATAAYIAEHGLSRRYPLAYTNTPQAFRYHWLMGPMFMPNYQGSAIWSWHGVFYLKLLKRYKHDDYASEYKKFARMITDNHTWPELLNPDGSWYYAPFYKGDHGMIWCSLFLTL